MSILVGNDEKSNIEVKIRYIDKGVAGVRIFIDKEEEDSWVEKETTKRNNKKIELKAAGEEVPENLNIDAKEEVKQLKTFWRRADWGTQSKIVSESSKLNDATGESGTDWTKYRMSQMKNLMIAWDMVTADGEAIPINEPILKKMDFNVALTLIALYEREVNPDEEELENLE